MLVVYKTQSYYNLSQKQSKFYYISIIVSTLVLALSLTFIGILTYKFLKASIAEVKVIEDVTFVPSVPWIRNYSPITSISAIKSTIKPLNEQYIVCYYVKNNDLYYNGLSPLSINPNLCTHVIIGFASVINNTIDLGKDLSTYSQMVKLKNDSPNLKIMLSVGGAESETDFPEMVSNHANRKIFIKSVLNVMKDLNLDGLDLDWEFPNWAVQNNRQSIHFVQLVYELKKEFSHSGKNLTLSAAVAASQAIIDISYEVLALAEHIDFINLMSYDYHFYVWYYPLTDLNAPLYAQSSKNGYLASLNVNYSANYWISKGMPREKIVIGIPLYGHSYNLMNPSNHDIQAPSRGYGSTGNLGYVSYTETCDFLKNGAVRVFVNDSQVPYTYKNNEWISYDDVTSIISKSMWIKSNGFKGAMVFSLNMDDWNSTCSPDQYFPLTNAVKTILNPK